MPKTIARLRLARARRLTAGVLDHEHPAWSPDGRTLAFSAGPVDDRRVFLVDRKGRLLYAVAPGGPRATRPRWAPDGRRIAFDARLEDGSTRVHVQDLPDMGHDPRPLIGQSSAGLRPAPLAGESSAVAPRPGAHVGEAQTIHAAYSPDGRTVAFSSDAGSPGLFHLFLHDLESGERRKLTEEPDDNDAHPTFSPDGTLLAFHRYHGEHARSSSIFLLNVGSGALLRLTEAAAFDKHACFATQDVLLHHREFPDGSQELRALDIVEGDSVSLDEAGARSGKRDAKQPDVRVTRRGTVRVAFAGRPREAVRGSPRPYDLHVATLDGLKG